MTRRLKYTEAVNRLKYMIEEEEDSILYWQGVNKERLVAHLTNAIKRRKAALKELLNMKRKNDIAWGPLCRRHKIRMG